MQTPRFHSIFKSKPHTNHRKHLLPTDTLLCLCYTKNFNAWPSADLFLSTYGSYSGKQWRFKTICKRRTIFQESFLGIPLKNMICWFIWSLSEAYLINPSLIYGKSHCRSQLIVCFCKGWHHHYETLCDSSINTKWFPDWVFIIGPGQHPLARFFSKNT